MLFHQLYAYYDCTHVFVLPVVILDKYHWMLYFLATAMYPRLLMTLNEELESFPVTVRVGQVNIHHNVPRMDLTKWFKS